MSVEYFKESVEGNIVSVGWVSLSKSGKSLTIRVQGQFFFVPLGDLYRVLDKERERADVKKWVEQKEPQTFKRKLSYDYMGAKNGQGFG